MDRVGRQSPTVSVILPYRDTKGPEAIELYDTSEKDMLEWQTALTYDIMAVDDDGLWIHQKFGYSVPRRNGKSEMALARCIWGLKHGERILYTAHRASTAHSIWERLSRLCVKCGVHIDSSFRAFGKEHLYADTEGVIEFRTRTSTGGLGEGFDLLIIDEAQEYTPEQETALKYVVTDSANPQTILFGTPPTAISAGTVFPNLRKRILQSESYASGWAEWSVPEMSDPHDVDLWYETNPSLGTVLKERTIRSEIGDDGTDFNIQRLGLWIKYNQRSAISRNEWEALQLSKMPKLVGQMFVGIKFGVDGNNVALAVAVRTADKKIFCEVIGCKPIRDGVDWMVDFIYRSGAKIVAVDGKSGTDILRDAMKEAKLKRPEVMTVQQVIKANALFDMAMEQGTFVHMHQSAVTQVVSNCERRKIGSNGGLGYASSLDGADIALLESMIIAHWICSETKAEKKKQKVSY
jgi:phage terminase large subunit-like protein